MDNILKSLNIVDALLIGAFSVFAVSNTWESVVALIFVLLVKALSVYTAAPNKKDDLKPLEEQIRKIQSDVNALNIKLGFRK